MEAKVMSSVSMAASALASSSSTPRQFLAAGSAPGSPNPCLAIFSTAARAPGVGALKMVARIPSPEPFCRLSWSRPREVSWSSSPFPTGLVAGGLQSGLVAVWDPRELLSEYPESGLVIIDDYLDRLRFQGATADLKGSPRHLLLEDSESDSSSGLEIIEDYFTPKDPRLNFTGPSENLIAEGHQKRATPVEPQLHEPGWTSRMNIIERTCNTTAGHKTPATLVSEPERVIDNYFPEHTSQPHATSPTGTLDARMVTLLSCYSGPVRGLSFSPTRPEFLASAAQGNLIIWDLVNPCTNGIANFQCNQAGSEFSYVSWNALIPNIIASASNFRVGVWDLNLRSPLLRELSVNENCTVVEWSPTNQNLMVVAARGSCDLPALKVWDVRKMDGPVQIFKGTGGIVSLSWSPFDDDDVLACTGDNKILIVNVKKGEVVFEKQTADACLDIKWCPDAEDHFALASSNEVKMYHKC